jgi:hypothetical protein
MGMPQVLASSDLPIMQPILADSVKVTPASCMYGFIGKNKAYLLGAFAEQ